MDTGLRRREGSGMGDERVETPTNLQSSHCEGLLRVELAEGERTRRFVVADQDEIGVVGRTLEKSHTAALDPRDVRDVAEGAPEHPSLDDERHAREVVGEAR